MPRRRNNRKKTGGKGTVTKGQVQQMIKSVATKDEQRVFSLTATGTTVTPASITNTGTMYNLESIAQGSGNQTRRGNNARVKHLTYNANLYADSTDVINVFRVVIFRWNDNTTAVVGDLFTSSNYSTSYYNIDNILTGKLEVLFDKSYCTGTTAGGAKHCHVDMALDRAIQWNSASAVPAIQGSMNLFVVSDSTAIPSPTIAGNATLLLQQ